MIDDSEHLFYINTIYIILFKLCILLFLLSFNKFFYYEKEIIISKTKLIMQTKYNKSFIDMQNKNKIKVCLCTLGKKENRYIKEFVNHYKKYGIDKIFLYDNNNINDERFEDIIYDYLEENFVEIIDYRGKIAPQFHIFTHCYNNNYKKYDWLIFYDIDEYINLKNYTNIKNFLTQNIFNKCKIIYLNCFRHTDNDLLHYDNRSLEKRFPYIKWESRMYTVKSIIRGNLKNITFKTSHWLDRSINGCNSYGKEIKPTKYVKMNNTSNIIFSNNNSSIRNVVNGHYLKDYYIDHYCFKSTEEYINKINKGDGIFGYKNKTIMHKIHLYFKYNKITSEKIKYIEKETNLDLSQYKLELIKSKKKKNKYLLLE